MIPFKPKPPLAMEPLPRLDEGPQYVQMKVRITCQRGSPPQPGEPPLTVREDPPPPFV